MNTANAGKAASLAIDYRFAVDAQLQTIDAQVCFRGAAPAQLVGGLAASANALRGAWRIDPAGRQPLPVVDGRILLEKVGSGGCIEYLVELQASRDRHGFAFERRGRAVATNIALWLWRPPTTVTTSSSTARLQLPSGMRASVPWPQQGDHYQLDPSAFAFYAYAAFGQFELDSVCAPSATLEVAVLDGLSAATAAQVVPWLQQAARLAAQPFGRFPRSHAQLVVVPSEPGPGRHRFDAGDDPVHFGTVTRGGGASALMLLASDARREALLSDWVAVHEFSHLLLPFLRHEDAWLSEGAATYYQEVLRVRAGVEPEADAWRRLFEGASLGREATQTLAQESAQMMHTHGFKRVYWAGAAFALLTDAELRRTSHGQLTLDALLRDLAPRTAAQSRPLQARELLAQLDALAPSPLFTQAMRRWVQGPTLPDLSELYAALGVDVQAGKVELNANAPDAWIRHAIMHPSP